MCSNYGAMEVKNPTIYMCSDVYPTPRVIFSTLRSALDISLKFNAACVYARLGMRLGCPQRICHLHSIIRQYISQWSWFL